MCIRDRVKIPDAYKQFLSENINFSNLMRKDENTTLSINLSPRKPGTTTGQIQGIDSSIRSNFGVSSGHNEVAGFKSITDFVQWENSVRLIGVSLFPVNYDNIEFMGIRLELFDELSLKYDPPFYVILKPSVKRLGIWELFKHNLPKYINIHQHWQLITKDTDTSDSNIMKFANLCYKDLLKVHSRVQFFRKLEGNYVNDKQYSLLHIDNMGLNVSFRLGADIIKIKVDDGDDEIIDCTFNGEKNISLLGSIYGITNRFQSIIM